MKVHQPAVKGHHQFVQRRLKEMEGHHFFRMDVSGEFHNVGDPQDTWTPAEVDNVMPRVRELATDPARGTKLSDMGLEEASVALSAEHLHVFTHLERESTGEAEFRDEHGVAWDVKSPLSPPPEQGWAYSPEHQLEKVRKDFGQGDQVLLNLTRVTSADRDATLALFKQSLNSEERGQILFFSDYQVA